MKNKVFYIIGGLILSAAIAAAVGLGIWAFSINNQLTQTQADYQALEADYQALNTDYEKLEAEYSKAKEDFKAQSSKASAELASAQAQVEKLEGDLKAAQKESDSLKAKLASIRDKVAVLDAFWFSSDASFQRKVDTMGDEQLKALYTTLIKTESWDAYIELMSYMIESITDVSNTSWQPFTNGFTFSIDNNVKFG